LLEKNRNAEAALSDSCEVRGRGSQLIYKYLLSSPPASVEANEPCQQLESYALYYVGLEKFVHASLTYL